MNQKDQKNGIGVAQTWLQNQQQEEARQDGVSMPKPEVQAELQAKDAAGQQLSEAGNGVKIPKKGYRPYMEGDKSYVKKNGAYATDPNKLKQARAIRDAEEAKRKNGGVAPAQAQTTTNPAQGTTQTTPAQGADQGGTDDYMDSFRSIMEMLDEDNTASASTTPTYPAGYPGYGYGYPGYYPSSLGDVTSMLEPYHMPTKEDLKKEKRNMAIRALGDGISAIAGMAGAINGGPNTVDATNSLTKTGRELIEKMREQRRKDYTAYLNAALKREQTNAANLRAMTQLERSREVSRRGRQTLALNVLDKINRWKNAKDANEIKDAHNKAIEAINKAKAEVEKQYKQGLISAKERKLTLDEYDNVTKRINADANMMRAQKAGSGGSKSGGGSNGEAKITVTENTDRYGDTKTTTRISGTAAQVEKAQNQRGSGRGGGKFENTKKLGL